MPATAYRFESCRGHDSVTDGGPVQDSGRIGPAFGVRVAFERRRVSGEAVDDAPIAQLDRALDYGSKGWGFDSSRAHVDLVLREDRNQVGYRSG